MKKTRSILCVLLAIFALVIIWSDYTDGHEGQDLSHINFCPLCALFGTTEAPQSVRALFDFPRLPLVGSIFIFFAVLEPPLLFLSLFALRAPPASR